MFWPLQRSQRKLHEKYWYDYLGKFWLCMRTISVYKEIMTLQRSKNATKAINNRPRGYSSSLFWWVRRSVGSFFFTLFFRFWPDCPYPLYLISNYKTFSSPRVQTLQVGKDRGWASGILTTLEKIPEDYVLYLQEDYLLCGRPDTDRIHSLISYMIHSSAGYLRLYPVLGPSRPTSDNPDVGIIDKGASYRTSLQVAVWKKSVLKMIVREGETVWDFECLGSIRSNALDCPFLCVTRYESLDGDINGISNLPLPYYATAIIKGRWLPGAIGLCRREGISIDLAYQKVWSKFWLHPIGRAIQLWIGRPRQLFKIPGFIKTPNSHMSFRNVLPSYIDFVIPGFERSYPKGISSIYHLVNLCRQVMELDYWLNCPRSFRLS